MRSTYSRRARSKHVVARPSTWPLDFLIIEIPEKTINIPNRIRSIAEDTKYRKAQELTLKIFEFITILTKLIDMIITP